MILTTDEINDIQDGLNENYSVEHSKILDSFKNYDRIELIINSKDIIRYKGIYKLYKDKNIKEKFEFKSIQEEL